MKRQWRASLLKQAHREIDLLMLHYRAQGNGSQLKYYGGVRRSLQPLYALPSQKPSRYERELSTTSEAQERLSGGLPGRLANCDSNRGAGRSIYRLRRGYRQASR